jgi:SOS-response transcriptional repressor LexA
MEDVKQDHELVRALVNWAKSNPKRVADAIKVSPSTINRHYNRTATTRLGRVTLLKLERAFPDFPGWAERNNGIRSEVAQYGDRPFEEKYGSSELPAIPVLGSAMGAASFDPERDIETTELHLSEVLEHIRRPASLAGDAGAYAVTVVGDSMWPRFRPGRRVIVSPRAPVSIGDDVIVQLRGDTVEMSQADKDPVTLVLIKELVRRTASHIELRQFNPDQTFRVERDRVVAMHKVIGEVY